VNAAKHKFFIFNVLSQRAGMAHGLLLNVCGPNTGGFSQEETAPAADAGR
jgi:hypothetical protein